MASYLPPVEKPKSVVLKLMYRLMRRRFGKVMTPFTVFSARLPLGFLLFYGKVAKLDKKLVLASRTAVLVRAQVATINACEFCMDASRWFALQASPDNGPRFAALGEYRTSPLFTEAERAAIDYATELTRDKRVDAQTFDRLAPFYSEREICDLVWLVASEHLYNMSNVGLNIGSDNLCGVRRRAAAAAS
jgi:alkylhydroperoxidase family enzyme